MDKTPSGVIVKQKMDLMGGCYLVRPPAFCWWPDLGAFTQTADNVYYVK
jgi:hypothetical protein